MILNLNEYKVTNVITEQKAKLKLGKFKCTNKLDLNVGDIVLTKSETEPPIVIKTVANTLDCYSLKENDDEYDWYRFPYLVQPKDIEFVYKLKLLHELTISKYLLEDDVYTGESFMFFEKYDANLCFNTYTKTEIKGVYIKTRIFDSTQDKRLMVLSNHRFKRLTKYNTLRFNEYITPDACDMEWLAEIKNFIEPILK